MRYHDPRNWSILHDTLTKMGRTDLIGNRKDQLIPTRQPTIKGEALPTKAYHHAPPNVPRLSKADALAAKGRSLKIKRGEASF